MVTYGRRGNREEGQQRLCLLQLQSPDHCGHHCEHHNHLEHDADEAFRNYSKHLERHEEFFYEHDMFADDNDGESNDDDDGDANLL